MHMVQKRNPVDMRIYYTQVQELGQLRNTYGRGDVAGRGSSDWCQVWGTQVYGRLHPLVQVQREPPQSLGAALPVWHETHPRNTQ